VNNAVPEWIDPDDEVTTDYYLCDACSGTGESYDLRECPACDGKGEHTDPGKAEADHDAWVDYQLDCLDMADL
jgi:RecJ-like exonuclease